MTALSRIIIGTASLYGRIALTGRGGYALARLARNLIPRSQWKNTFTAPHGLKLNLDLATYPDCCMAMRLYETDTVRVLRKLLKPGMSFVDGGANLGYFTLLAAKLVGPTGRVDAFEPDPSNRLRLEAHVKGNGLGGKVRIHAVALSNDAGSVEMFHPEGNDANHGMTGSFLSPIGGGDRYRVEAVRLDERVATVPDVIKLDVEGAELQAIRGAAKFLKSEKPPAIIVEHNHETAAAAGYSPAELFRELVSIQSRYRVFWIGAMPRRIRTAEELQGIARQGNLLVRCP